jgi:hypothetical protein
LATASIDKVRMVSIASRSGDPSSRTLEETGLVDM